MDKVFKSFGTHSGSFHADEVTACALLLMAGLIDRSLIIRTREPEELAKCEYVCDVGGVYDPKQKLFDHHQVDYQGPLSSAGMVLHYLNDKGFLSNGAYEYFNRSLILGVDAHDNGREPPVYGYCSFSNVISNLNPIEHNASQEEQERCFQHAVDFVLGHCERLLQRYEYMETCRQVVADAMQEEKHCLVFEKGVPWLEIFFEMNGESHPARFVIMPSGNHWKLRAIPPTYDERMKVRTPLPAEWAGLREEELKQVTGIPGAIFCHKGRFISVWETKQDALQALSYVLGKN